MNDRHPLLRRQVTKQVAARRSTHRAAPSNRWGHRSTLKTREPSKTIAFALSSVFLLAHVSLAPTAQGSVGVAPVPLQPPTAAAHAEDGQSGNLSLKIDAQNKIPWPRTNSLQINPLDLTQPSTHGFV